MAIPKYNELQLPILETLKEQSPLRAIELANIVAANLKLTEEEVNKMYDSGKGPIFKDRIQWACSYLSMIGYVDKPKRGNFAINTTGLRALETPEDLPQQVRELIQKRKKARNKNRISDKATNDLETPTISMDTPREVLLNTYQSLVEDIYDEIINTILKNSSYAFETLVVQLLQKMGYGGKIANSGFVTQRSNDGGIDGIIKEDVLGLGRISIQAKCYNPENSVSRQEIQKFVGALATSQSSKGVFITTSSFSPAAKKYAENLNGQTTIVLVDGQQLAEYIYEYGLGMQTDQVLKIKKLDTDFWDNM